MRSLAYAAMTCALIATSVVPAQDTVRVRATAAPLWGTNVKLTPSMSVGVADGPDEYSFGSLDRTAADRKGRLYIYDGQDRKLRQYDANGKFVQNIGTFGKGPGEFETVSDLVITEDSVVFVRDGSQARVLFYFPNGKLRNGFTDARLSHEGFPSVTVDNQGYITTHVFTRVAGVTGMDRVRYKHLVRMRTDGTVVDSMPFPVALPLDGSTTFTAGAFFNFVPQSFYAPLRSGGFVAGNNDAMRFMIRRPTGPVRVVERPWTPVTLGREERNNWQEIAQNRLERLKGARMTKPPSFDIPSTKPAYRGLFADDDSRIWVSVYAPAKKVELPPPTSTTNGPRLTWRQPDVYDVFSDTGEYLGRVEMPPQVYLVKAQGNRIWTHTTGPDDEEIMRVYTMSGGGSLRR